MASCHSCSIYTHTLGIHGGVQTLECGKAASAASIKLLSGPHWHLPAREYQLQFANEDVKHGGAA